VNSAAVILETSRVRRFCRTAPFRADKLSCCLKNASSFKIGSKSARPRKSLRKLDQEQRLYRESQVPWDARKQHEAM
jgi:hypothetical protein